MKKTILGIAVIGAAFIMSVITSPYTAHAWEWETVTFEGNVTRPDGSPVQHIMVWVDCLDGPSEFTDTKGHYVIKGSAHLCLGDSIAVQTAIQYSPNLNPNDAYTLLDGTAHTTTSTYKVNKADIKMGVRTIPIPEYDWVAGTVAATAGTGAIIYTRRRLS